MVTATPALAEPAVLQEAAIIEIVTDAAMARLQVPRRDVQVVWQDVSASSLVPALPDGRMTLQISPTAHLGGRASVPIQILIDGKHYRTIFPRLDVEVFEQVLVSTTRIARGELADGQSVTLQRKSITGTYQAPLTNLAAVLGAEATRDISQGTVLTASMFRLPTVIKSGDLVTIVLTSGDLTIIANGQARSSGAMGEMIKVLNLDSKREFTARVTAPNRVEVKLEE